MGQSRPPAAEEPVDPDLPDSPPPARRAPAGHGQLPVVCAVSVGGGIGAAARYGASLLWPTEANAFPWTTFFVNVAGCAAIGVFLVLATEVWAAHRLVRPFFGTGVLGGFTTFSAYAVDIQRLVDGGRAATGLGYLAATLVAALAAVWATARLTRRAIAWRTRLSTATRLDGAGRAKERKERRA